MPDLTSTKLLLAENRVSAMRFQFRFWLGLGIPSLTTVDFTTLKVGLDSWRWLENVVVL